PREGSVAAPAGHLDVGSAQRIPGLLMERALYGRALQHQPSVDAVAALALLPVPVLVGVAVAGGASRGHDGLEARGHVRARGGEAAPREVRIALARVAGDALQLGVLSLQREVGARVVEPGRVLPAVLVVAVLARFAQLPAVLVEVAGRALDGYAEVGLPPVVGLAQLVDGRVHDQAVLVALVALEQRVLAEEREPGVPVVEAGLASFSPVDQGEIPALVLVVALVASPVRIR